MKLSIIDDSKLSKLVTWKVLNLSEDKINVLLGINGSGKTLLLNSISHNDSKNIMIDNQKLNLLVYDYFYVTNNSINSAAIFKSSGEKGIISFFSFLENIQLSNDKLNLLIMDDLDKSMSINFLMVFLHYLTELKKKTPNFIIVIAVNTYIPNIYDLNFICVRNGSKLIFNSFDDYYNYYINEHLNKGITT